MDKEGHKATGKPRLMIDFEDENTIRLKAIKSGI